MFTLPNLPYKYTDLLPYIDEATMRIHHDLHHATYLNNLNTALAPYPELFEKSIEYLIEHPETVPDDCRIPLINNGGGFYNHSLFWKFMSPASNQQPGKVLSPALEKEFSSISEFKKQFELSGVKQFGSGWVWLVINVNKKLEIISTANQDNPLTMQKTPLFCIDVWEHAYYLKYQNRRAEYLSQFWNIVNWNEIESRFIAATT